MPTADKYISKIEIGNNLYLIKDAEGRLAIEDLKKQVSQAIHYRGVVDTAKNTLKDGITTSPIWLEGEAKLTPEIGDLVLQNATPYQLEFIWNGTAWNEFGKGGSLGKFAYFDEGEVTVPTITKGARSVVSVSGKISVSGTVAGQDAPVTGTVKITGTNASEAAAATNSYRYTPRTSIKTGGSVEIKKLEAGVISKQAVVTGITGSGGSFVDDYNEADEKLTLRFTAPNYKPTTGEIAYTAPTLENLGTDFAVTLNSDVKAAVDAQTIASSGTNTLSSTKQYLEDVTIDSTKATVTPKTPTPTV